MIFANIPSARDAHPFYGVCALLWGFFCVMAFYTPVLLDDWYQVAWHQRHGMSLAELWSYARYNYFNYNPRLGENFLLLVNGPRAIHMLLTPTVELLLLACMFVMAFGRWPRADRRDATRLLLALVLLWLAVPIPGVMFFYRPFTTNYLFALCIQLLLFVPYRLEIERDRPAPARLWMVPTMLLAGWAAGMTNEHTGPTAIVALLALIYALWRKHRQLRAWMVAGFLGLFVGYPMLFFAPGQSLRYGGLATKASVVETVTDRGVDGTWQILIDFFTESMLVTVFVVVAVLVAFRAERRHAAASSSAPPRIERRHLLVMLPLMLAALAVVCTLFASPVVGERTFFAPAALFVCALLVALDALQRDGAARRFLVVACLVLFSWHGIRFLTIYPNAYADNQQRMATIAATPAGAIAKVEPYRYFGRSRYYLGDDFSYASLREYVAHEVFGKQGIEFTRPVRAEPSAPLGMSLEPHMDPPMAPEAVLAQIELPLSYLPSYVDREIQVVRRIDEQLKSIPGHRLIDVEAPVRGLSPPFLRGRKFLGVRWNGRELAFIDGRRLVDKLGMPYFLLWRGTVPPGLTDGYVLSCGKVEQVPLTRDPDGKGLRMSYVPKCRGLYLGVACTAEECWLAASTWR